MKGNRRTRAAVLGAVIVGGLALAALSWPRINDYFQPPPPPRPPTPPPVEKIYPVAENLYVVPGGGCNTVVFVTSRGVILVDTKYQGTGDALLEQVRSVSDRPILYAVSTHAHPDHFGGTLDLPQETQVVVQERTARNLARLRRSGDRAHLEGRKVVTFTDRMTLLDGAEAVDLYYFGAAHTDGDAFVVFRAAGVLATGDVFSGKVAPTINLPWGGDPRSYPETLRRAVEQIPAVSQIIPGHAAVVARQDLQNYADFVRLLLDHVVAERAAGHDVNVAFRSLAVPPRFSDYKLDRLIITFHDMYKGLTPWWHFW